MWYSIAMFICMALFRKPTAPAQDAIGHSEYLGMSPFSVVHGWSCEVQMCRVGVTSGSSSRVGIRRSVNWRKETIGAEFATLPAAMAQRLKSVSRPLMLVQTGVHLSDDLDIPMTPVCTIN